MTALPVVTFIPVSVDQFDQALAVLVKYGFGATAEVSAADAKPSVKRAAKPIVTAAPEAPGKPEEAASPAPAEASAPGPASVSPAAPSSTDGDLYDAARAAAGAKLKSNAAFRVRIQALISTYKVDAIGKIPVDEIPAFTAAVTAMEI